MASAFSQWFDYEVTLVPARPREAPYRDSSIGWTGTAVSLPASRGELPGLAGARPIVRVAGDRLRVESSPAERPAAAWTEWLVLLVPPLHRRWISRSLLGAQVRAFELDVPGLGVRLREPLVLRVRCEFSAPGGGSMDDLVVVSLREGAEELWRLTAGRVRDLLRHAW